MALPLALSVEQDEALDLLDLDNGINTIVVFNPSATIVEYGGRMLIHTLNSPPDDQDTPLDQRRALRQIHDGVNALLALRGETQESFPAFALHGWVSISKVFQYDPTSFAADADRHGMGESLAMFAAESGYYGAACWGLRFNKAYRIVPPVVSVFPPQQDGKFPLSGSIWAAEAALHEIAFKMVLGAVVEKEEKAEELADDETV